jgi:hypothetical protein
MSGAEAFCAIRSYVATAARHGIGALDALTRAAQADPQGSGVFGTYGGLSGMHGCGAESHSCEHGHAT